MTENMLVRIFEHNHWANLQIIDICLKLSDEQLDAEPHSAAFGSIRSTLVHLAEAQAWYLRLLTQSSDQSQASITITLENLRESAVASGEGFVALIRDDARLTSLTRLQTRDGYTVAPWVVIVQAINHATEHREQIKTILTLLEVIPPDIDGWSYGDAMAAIAPISS